uniref:RBD domain-containing protein n=1 Tax=Graphocephala atropunctata TaxID=36148 RepID=A0A1B6LRI6_9HEMI
MFVTVKYGEGEKLKVNPNCYIRMIYDYIRKQLNIPPEIEFDLCKEDGERCHILEYPPNTNAAAQGILVPRQTFWVLVLQGTLNSGTSDTGNSGFKISGDNPREVKMYEESELHIVHNST